MTTVAHEDVRAAAGRIGGLALRTPVFEISPGFFLKLELLQHSGSFKVRGAFNRILSAGELPDGGVIAASGGNHGLAVAYAARELGVRAEIFVPEVTSPVKLAGLQALGAHITQTGAIYSEAAEAAAKRAAETGALTVHAYDQPEVIAGQGTTGLEIAEQTGGVDTVVVAVGGGGFAAGITLGTEGAASPGAVVSPGAVASPGAAAEASGEGPRIVAVEPERIPTLRAALEAGRPVPVEVSGVGADALGASKIGGLAFEILSGPRVESVLVADDAIMAARRTLWQRHHIAAEAAGAAAYAAVLSGVYTPGPGERVAVVVCGSNTDPATLTT
ncbi:pyridoxal-phosphate dependent enzyme [Nonomuraea mesophila]|uniref:threonine ammonia-lyase n=1 Tax=Nonomuraea mesophila TaxID=2530382 RepID=A0A4R5EY50_9ACTN|nr:pyridoxal-phosphate dependent enzyme [Nonomuraea mesophila]TDE39974.1 pyridoxal-phosphate dependent enzyme [Nonomuraea mesophila]